MIPGDLEASKTMPKMPDRFIWSWPGRQEVPIRNFPNCQIVTYGPGGPRASNLLQKQSQKYSIGLYGSRGPGGPEESRNDVKSPRSVRMDLGGLGSQTQSHGRNPAASPSCPPGSGGEDPSDQEVGRSAQPPLPPSTIIKGLKGRHHPSYQGSRGMLPQ